MKSAIIVITAIFLFLQNGFAEEDPKLNISPNKKFAVMFNSGEYPSLISMGSHQVILENLLDEQSRIPFVLWSEDSNNFACWVQQARFTAFVIYRREQDSFKALAIPEITLPFEQKLKGKDTDQVGESTCVIQWIKNDTLLMNKRGLINIYQSRENREILDTVEYSYDITIRFDKQGIGHILRIRKSPHRTD